MQLDSSALKKWFLNVKRDLPWRDTSKEQNDPYAVWVSEVMLQQTQVSVVIPYFEKFMENFPTIEALAKAPLEKVIKNWEGLGYYSRARNLHEGAKFVLENFQGQLPCSEKELLKIKGIGPYTLGALLSFAFRQKKAAVDGNVIRVLTRFFKIEKDISKPKTVTEIRKIAEDILPDEESWIISEGLIELGATVCTKKPKCTSCPLKKDCKGFLSGVAENLPIKSSKIKIERLFRNVTLVFAENKFLVKKGKKGEIMADLYEFPFIQTPTETSHEINEQLFFLKLPLKKERDLPKVKHSFTRFNVTLTAALFSLDQIKPVLDYEWLSMEELDLMPFSSGHKRLYELVKASIK